jgi:hypothetical protein
VNKTVHRGTKYYDRLNDTASFVIEKGLASGKTIQVVTDSAVTRVLTVNRISKFKPSVNLSNGAPRWIKIEDGVK